MYLLLLLSTGADLYTGDEHELWRSCRESNSQLIESLRADSNEDALHKLATDDWKKSRLSEPKPASEYDLGKVRNALVNVAFARLLFISPWQVRCVPRFGVEQGVKADGSMKLRAIDNFSWSYNDTSRKRKRTKKVMKAASVNGHYEMPCVVEHDHLDQLLAAMRMHNEVIGEARVFIPPCGLAATCPHDIFLQAPGLWKSDVDSAFRRVPVNPEHRWATGVQRRGCQTLCFACVCAAGTAYLHHGVPLVALHNGMPFGATASVVAWHRIGAFMATTAREVLHLPVYRYVDDYFAAERYSSC